MGDLHIRAFRVSGSRMSRHRQTACPAGRRIRAGILGHPVIEVLKYDLTDDDFAVWRTGRLYCKHGSVFQYRAFHSFKLCFSEPFGKKRESLLPELVFT